MLIMHYLVGIKEKNSASDWKLFYSKDEEKCRRENSLFFVCAQR